MTIISLIQDYIALLYKGGNRLDKLINDTSTFTTFSSFLQFKNNQR